MNSTLNRALAVMVCALLLAASGGLDLTLLHAMADSFGYLTSIRLIPEICCYIHPVIVRDALRDLEMIRVAGVDGLEPTFDLLESKLPRQVAS